MTDYVLLALIAAVGYAAQTAFMAPYYRRLDPLAATAARGLSLGVSMLPLVFLSGWSALLAITDHLGLLAAASAAAVFGNWASAYAYRFLPVGVANSLQESSLMLFICLIGIIHFREPLTAIQIVALLFIVFGNVCVTLQPNAAILHLDHRAATGMILSLVFGFFLSIGFACVSALSRAADPLAAAYCWEFTIGLFCLAPLAFRRRSDPGVWSISRRDFVGIFAAAAPTAIGSGCYTLAVIHGSVAIVTAVLAAVPALASAFSYLCYRERLSVRQMLAIAVIAAAVVLLRVG